MQYASFIFHSYIQGGHKVTTSSCLSAQPIEIKFQKLLFEGMRMRLGLYKTTELSRLQ